jgi:hypothetical protein
MSEGIEYEYPSGATKGRTRAEAKNTQIGRELIREINILFSYGVPLVLSSGNEGEQEGRQVIDHMPQVSEAEDFPLINVGAATLDGKAAPLSQGQGTQDGTQLSIYGVGVDVQVHNHVDGPTRQISGTSFAAPAVAGIIAVHMNYQPWDQSKKGIDRVKEIKRWITTSESSWERATDPDKQVNMVSSVTATRPSSTRKPQNATKVLTTQQIWNGADKAAHDSVSNNQAPESSSPVQTRTFVVGLEQTASPDCEIYTPWGVNQLPSTVCKALPRYENRYFFYRLDDNAQEVDSLCTSLLNDFHQDDQGVTKDENLFEHPTWPVGVWTLSLFGEEFTYKNNGQSPGALFKGEQQIGCTGDLGNHGKF